MSESDLEGEKQTFRTDVKGRVTVVSRPPGESLRCFVHVGSAGS